MIRPAERTLIYGAEGVGKSLAWLDIAAHTDGTLYIIDTDKSAAYTIYESGQADKVNVELYDVSDPDGALVLPNGNTRQHATQWEAVYAATMAIRKAKPTAKDWIVIDRLDSLWDAVQSDWIIKAYGSDQIGYWTDLRADQLAKPEGGTTRDYGGFEGRRDWPQIKQSYNYIVDTLLHAPLCHKLAVTLAKQPFGESALAQEQAAMYGELMPAGEKNQGAKFHLVAEIKIKTNGDRALFVRRTRRRVWEPTNPYVITTVEGEPAFVDGFYGAEHWGWE